MWPATTLTTLMGSDGRGIGGIEGAERLDGKLGVLTPDGGLVEGTEGKG